MGIVYVIIHKCYDSGNEQTYVSIEGKAYATLERAKKALSDFRDHVVFDDIDGYSGPSTLYENGRCFDYSCWGDMHELEIQKVELDN